MLLYILFEKYSFRPLNWLFLIVEIVTHVHGIWRITFFEDHLFIAGMPTYAAYTARLKSKRTKISQVIGIES